MQLPEWIRNFRWNWGWALLLVFVTFMTVFLYVFYLSFKELRSNEMYVKDYYTEELNYGKVLAKKQNADTMQTPVKIVQNQDGLTIVFPDYLPLEKVKGTLVLYRPNKKLFDKTIPLELDTTRKVFIPLDSLLYGRWDVQLNWQVDSTGYYIEKQLWIKK